jgi:hypothetical protein
MFENLKDKEKEEGKLNEKVDDIFAETEGSVNEEKDLPKDDVPNPMMPQSPEAPEAPAENFDELEDSGPGSGGILKKIFIAIIVLAVIGIAAYLVYSLILVPQAEELEKEAKQEVVLDDDDLDFINDIIIEPVIEDDLDLIEEEPIEEDIIEEDPIEEDIIEEELSIDIQILKTIDSDGDGISDYDEIYVIGTDPFNPDTSGNNFNDLTEITNCYDPFSKEGRLDISLFVDPELFMERFPEVVENCNLSLE